VTPRQIQLRPTAKKDLQEASDFYLREGGAKVAARFLALAERAFSHIIDHPLSGSRRLSVELRVEGLRSWAISGFPYLVIYRLTKDVIDILRVLHTSRDVPDWFDEDSHG